ncbi:MAB_1171c family putative transporter [Streptomyces rishiriensis]|uniref:MAB_1171c family putative transporter n=1 Tax=Streptomyces rishiriensis TaxID=68264 RepID=UPI0037CDBB22
MKDILHPLCLAIASVGFLVLLRDLKRDRRDRDRALVALAASYLASALSHAVSMTWVWVRVDSFFGVPNIVVPLAQSFVILVLVLQSSVLAYWSKTPKEARRRSRHLLITGAAVIVGMTVLFALLTPATQRPLGFANYYAHDPAYQAYALLYFGTYTVAEIYLARACWKYARKVNDPWISRGLRLVTAGALITLGYSGIRIAAVVGAGAGAGTGFSVDDLNDFAWACGDIGAALTQVGYFIPIVATRTAAALAWHLEHCRYRHLEDLWQAMADAEPSIVLERPVNTAQARRERRSVAFDLYRRTVEIRDAQIELGPYLDPAIREEAERRRHAWWRSSAQFAAAVTADQIHAALVQKQHGTIDEPTSYADADLNTFTTSKDLRHLVRVAAYFTTPAASESKPRSTTGART